MRELTFNDIQAVDISGGASGTVLSPIVNIIEKVLDGPAHQLGYTIGNFVGSVVGDGLSIGVHAVENFLSVLGHKLGLNSPTSAPSSH